MRKNILKSISIFCLLFFLFLIGCKKDPAPGSEVYAPKLYYEASYWIQRPCNQFISPDSVQYIDSLLLFTNMSGWTVRLPDTMPLNPDTNYTKTYRWDFGDNSFSTDKHTSHRYTLPGTYKVELVTFLNSIPSDTMTRYVRILNGQREIKTSYSRTTCIDFDEAPNNCSLLLLSSYNSVLDPPSYSLRKIDSNFRTIWTKQVPGNNIRLNSLKKLANNDYILSGSFTGNTDKFAITRITGDGDLVWTKYISNVSGTNVYTIPTSDGNLVTIGDTSTTNSGFTVIVKCTSNGDEIWRRSFNTGFNNSVRAADNIIETGNGYLFAATKPDGSYGKIVLTALDGNGNIIQQAEKNAGNWGTIFSAGVVKSGNVYMVYPVNSIALYFFTDNLVFSSSAELISASGINHAVSFNGFFYVAEGAHQYSRIIKYSTSGSPVWSYSIKNDYALSCSTLWSGGNRYCKKVLCTPNDVIGLSYGFNDPNAFSMSVFVEKVSQSEGLLR